MIIKTYTVENMKEAVVRAKYELGKEAIIISQQEIKVGKWYNPFKKKKLRVTFALEEEASPKIMVKEVEEKKEVEYSIEELLEKNPMLKNISDRTRGQLLGYLKLNMKDENNLSIDEIVDFTRIAFKDNCFEKKVRARKTNVFVGPTGAGKTTTIAKIAAHEKLVNKKKVGLLTIDTYKIGEIGRAHV